MVLPLGLLNAYWARVVWLAVLLASLILSMRISWRMYGDGIRPPTVFLLAGYLFAPVPACLAAGQLGLVLLLGIVLFLFLVERHPLLAGAALLIPCAKPRLFSLLWPILAIWIASRKKWSLAVGFALAFSSAVAMAWAFDLAVFWHYREMLRQSSIQFEFIPALSGVLRLIFFRRLFWAQFLPLAAGLLWSGWYYCKNRRIWSWKEHGPALLVVSVLTTPYAWITDEAILLPAILQGVLWVYRAKPNLTLRSQLAISVFACLDGLLLLILRAKIPFATGIYFWSSLVWVSWYWSAQRFRRSLAA
jgi:Glycosyltransferase family 87